MLIRYIIPQRDCCYFNKTIRNLCICKIIETQLNCLSHNRDLITIDTVKLSITISSYNKNSILFGKGAKSTTNLLQLCKKLRDLVTRLFSVWLQSLKWILRWPTNVVRFDLILVYMQGIFVVNRWTHLLKSHEKRKNVNHRNEWSSIKS